jgi:hypothetical protein
VFVHRHNSPGRCTTLTAVQVYEEPSSTEPLTDRPTDSELTPRLWKVQKCRPARERPIRATRSHLLLQVNDSGPLSVASTVDDATRSVSVTSMKDLGSCVLYRIASCNCVGSETIPLSRAAHTAFHSVFMCNLWATARSINNHL